MLKNFLSEKKVFVEDSINLFLNELTYPTQIAEGMKYAVLNGGKRIRPILLLMILDLFDKDEKLGVPSAAARDDTLLFTGSRRFASSWQWWL